MVRPRGHLEGSTFVLADQAVSSRETDGAYQPLDEGDRLTFVHVGTGAGTGPFRAEVLIHMNGRDMTVKGKWVRGNTDFGGSGGFEVMPGIILGSHPFLLVAARNYTGAEITVDFQWITERTHV